MARIFINAIALANSFFSTLNRQQWGHNFQQRTYYCPCPMTYRLFLFSQLQPASKWNFLCCMQKLWKTIKIIVIIVISTWLCYAAFHTCTARSTQQFIKFIGSGLFLHLPFVSLLPSGNSCIGNLCVCVCVRFWVQNYRKFHKTMNSNDNKFANNFYFLCVHFFHHGQTKDIHISQKNSKHSLQNKSSKMKKKNTTMNNKSMFNLVSLD